MVIGPAGVERMRAGMCVRRRHVGSPVSVFKFYQQSLEVAEQSDSG